MPMNLLLFSCLLDPLEVRKAEVLRTCNIFHFFEVNQLRSTCIILHCRFHFLQLSIQVGLQFDKVVLQEADLDLFPNVVHFFHCFLWRCCKAKRFLNTQNVTYILNHCMIINPFHSATHLTYIAPISEPPPKCCAFSQISGGASGKVGKHGQKCILPPIKYIFSKSQLYLLIYIWFIYK